MNNQTNNQKSPVFHRTSPLLGPLPERADFRLERVDFRPERADFRPERAWGEQMDGWTK